MGDSDIMDSLGAYPQNKWIVVTRFICGVVLHMALQDELKQGLDNMKYALNHEWRFENWKIAFFSGFLQTTVIVLIEFVNFLAILTSFTTLDVVLNFLALCVISDFDDFFYGSLRDEPLKELLNDPCYEELLMIERTTSQRAAFDAIDHKLTKDALDIAPGEEEKLKNMNIVPVFIHQPFLNRKIMNMGFMSFYRFCRVLYVSVWFYFLPFLVLLGSYYVPWYLQ